MLNNIKTVFSIKDLENFSGIKAHTIRIWEKRYGLLEPCRTEYNIRYYDDKNFIKLLNITLLNNNGLKISKIAELSDNDIILNVKEFATLKLVEEFAINSFKISMMKFDVVLFNDTFNKLISRKSLREIFVDIFIPLLEHIGFLWQTGSIKPIHEHFISNLIAQKIHSNIDINQSSISNDADKIFVLYLPLGEIHELGLLYIYYEITLRNYRTIYLGQNISLEHIAQLNELYSNIYFITYFTVQPEDIDFYLQQVNKLLLSDTFNKFCMLGPKAESISTYKSIKYFASINELLKYL
ncbi:MAG: MerR family transcriptional regulator [Flavobacteriaceae bacterium]|nr:MerR family transcriptional regulator [Flavobacteriaceae bacterium]